MHASVYLAEMAPGAQGPPLHTHEFDQFYFVIEGALEVQIGFDTQVVGPNTLVVLPAGVPHKQRNASDDGHRAALHDPRARASASALASSTRGTSPSS